MIVYNSLPTTSTNCGKSCDRNKIDMREREREREREYKFYDRQASYNLYCI